MTDFNGAASRMDSKASASPYYYSVLIDRLFVVRWRETPTPRTMDGLRREIEFAAGRLGRPLLYMAIIHAEEPPPEPALRTALYEFFRALQKPCAEMHLIVLGRGMKNSIIRSVITGGVLANGLRRFISVHDTVEAAIAVIAPTEGKPAERYLRELNARGLAGG